MKSITRREFLKGSVSVGAYACCSAALGITVPQLVFGQVSGSNGNLLVLFNQFGGNDPLNSFTIPFSLGKYYDIRPTIAIAENKVLKMNSGLGLHPALVNLHRLFTDGNVAVLSGMGEPVGTRSHFTSQDIMSLGVGTAQSSEKRGWIGRLGDQYFRNDSFNTFALGVGSKLDFTSTRLDNSAIIVPTLNSYTLQDDAKAGVPSVSTDSALQKEVAASLFEKNKSLSGIEQVANNSFAGLHRDSAKIKEIVTNFAPTVKYPNTKAGIYFKDISVIARSSLGAKLTYGGLGGWDNHANQGSFDGTQSKLLKEFDDALGVFEKDMKAASLWNKVAVCVFTEFGRTCAENNSKGTDHGWGSAMLVIGGKVKGQIYGEAPSVSSISQSWLSPQIDYRNPFREMVEWMGYSADPIFTENYTRTTLNIFKA